MLKTTTIPESRLASLKSTVFGWEANKWLALVSYLTKSSTDQVTVYLKALSGVHVCNTHVECNCSIHALLLCCG